MTRFKFVVLFFILFFYTLKSQVCFGPEITTPLSDAGQGITAKDFDGDGTPDVVVALGYINRVQLLRGQGTGSFVSLGLLNANYSPEYITSGDFNNDGNMDFAVNNGMYTATIFHGNGIFGFNAVVPSGLAAGWIPVCIANADFNSDGIKDMVLTNETTNNVSVLLSSGNLYGPNASTFAVGANPRSVVTADFNGDGNQDIAATNIMDNTISVLSGNGTGGFMPAISYSTDVSPAAMVTDDFNNDGRMDIVTANCGPNTGTTTISLMLNNGQGSFNASTNIYIGNYPYSVASGDFNGDNNRDLVVAVSFAQQLAILIGNGSGSFLTPLYISLSDYPNFVITDDFNGDGKDDIAIGHVYDVGVLLNVSNTLSVSASSSVICSGGTATLQVSNGYKGYLWDNSSTDSILVVSPLTTTSYTVSSTTTSNCVNSSIFTLSVSTCVGLNNSIDVEDNFLQIYPNPGTTYFTIESKTDMLVDITSFSGQLLKTIKLNDSNFHKTNFTDLSRGIYFVTGQTASKRITYKLIIGP